MIYTKSDVYNELKRYFTEDVDGNNDDLVYKIEQNLQNIYGQTNILRACNIIRDSIVNIKNLDGKPLFKDKKFLPKWVRYLVYVVIYQYLETNKAPQYTQSTLLKEMGLYTDIFGKKNWNMYSPDMKVRQSKYDCLKLPFNHAEVEANEIFRAMIHHMVCYSKILTNTFVDMNGKLGLVPAICANGYKYVETWVSGENCKQLVIFVYALKKKMWVCKELNDMKYEIKHSDDCIGKVNEFINMAIRIEFLIQSLPIETIDNNISYGLQFEFDVYRFAALFIIQQYFMTEYWMDSKLKTVQIENDENETTQYLTNELKSNVTINRVKDFLNDDYAEAIKQLSDLYTKKSFLIDLREFKDEIQILDNCLSIDVLPNDALLFIDVPKYLREEKRFDFNFEWYKKLFSVLSIYYGDWILSWKNFVELNKNKNSLYSEARTGDKILPIEILAYGVSRDEAEKAGIKQSEWVTEQNQDDTKLEENERIVNNIRSLYDDLAEISRNRQLYVYRYRDEDRNKPNSILFITTIDFMEISDADFQKRYEIDFYTSGYGLGGYKYLKKYRYEDFYIDVKKTVGYYL